MCFFRITHQTKNVHKSCCKNVDQKDFRLKIFPPPLHNIEINKQQFYLFSFSQILTSLTGLWWTCYNVIVTTLIQILRNNIVTKLTTRLWQHCYIMTVSVLLEHPCSKLLTACFRLSNSLWQQCQNNLSTTCENRFLTTCLQTVNFVFLHVYAVAGY